MDRNHTNFFGGGDVSKPSITRKHVQETFLLVFMAPSSNAGFYRGPKSTLTSWSMPSSIGEPRAWVWEVCRLEFSGKKSGETAPVTGFFFHPNSLGPVSFFDWRLLQMWACWRMNWSDESGVSVRKRRGGQLIKPFRRFRCLLITKISSWYHTLPA